MTSHLFHRPGRNRPYAPGAVLRTLLVVSAALAVVVGCLVALPAPLHGGGSAQAAPAAARVALAGVGGPGFVSAKPVRPTALGPTVNRFSGYDLTQATVCCGGGWASAPWVSAASYYNATMNSRTNLAHDTSAQVSSYYTLQVAVGQVVGLMCWLQTSTGTYWEKTDSRHVVNGVSNLYIAYLTDTFINVSRADLFNNVPHCDSASMAEFDRLVKLALAGVSA